MHSWPIVLPPLSFLALFVTLLGAEGADPADGEAWRRALVKAALVCGAIVTASTEILSLFHALTAGGLVLTWSVALLATIVACWRLGACTRVRLWVKGRGWRISFPEAALLAGLAAILLLTALVAWVSPPNTTDSHLYHMSRVVHWAENASLDHYPTSYEVQLWFPPWAETAILTLRLLWGNDQPAGLVQWLSYAGCLVVAAGIAGLLGAGRQGRWLAAVFCASIPMAILQSTSTQNDLAVAFWLLCIGYLLLAQAPRPVRAGGSLWMGLAIGLGILTKGTVFLYVAPFLIWYLAWVWSRLGAGGALRRALLLALCAVALNAGVWVRNLATYGSPIGAVGGDGGLVSLPPVAGWPVNWAAHSLAHLASPLEHANVWIAEHFHGFADLLGHPVSQFRLTWAWNHEDLAASPVHLAVSGLALLMLVLRRRLQNPLLVGYGLAAAAAFGLLTTFVTWNPYVVRLHLPFLVVMAPLVGATVDRWLRSGTLVLLSGLLLLLSLPWLLLNQTRPVVGLRPRTAIVSVFRAEKVDILFANWLPLRDDFVQAAEALEQTGCTQIGLRIDSSDLEYPIWWLLGAPQNGMRLEHLDTPDHLHRYADPFFRPCAILCTVCGGRARLHGLDWMSSFGKISLFVGNGYVPDTDGQAAPLRRPRWWARAGE